MHKTCAVVYRNLALTHKNRRHKDGILGHFQERIYSMIISLLGPKDEMGVPRIFAPSQPACIIRLPLFYQIHDVF